MRQRLQAAGQWHPGQMAGRRWPVGCVALEITQRCNLDCTLCYLSSTAEAIRDIPIEEIYRRIDLIVRHYGAGTDVQVTGGEPTLRRRHELVAIIRRLTGAGLRATLFTNGIHASRELLAELADAGLQDVAFHVDTTQQRRGYRTEEELNSLRETYIERARGLRIGVFFNTTVHAGNLDDVPMLARFFAAHADIVRLTSFQLQADTGRSILGTRPSPINIEGIAARVSRGIGTPLNFDALSAGHRDCNRCAVALITNDRAFDAYAQSDFVRRFMQATGQAPIDRRTPARATLELLGVLWRHPRLWAACLRWTFGLARQMRRDLIAARGRVHKLSFFIHNFMDACQLDPERIDTCMFMAMSQDGPLSMCLYNARRDDYLLRPLPLRDGVWQPLRADATDGIPIKLLRGRERASTQRKQHDST